MLKKILSDGDVDILNNRNKMDFIFFVFLS